MGDLLHDFLLNGLIMHVVLFILIIIKWLFGKFQTWRKNRMLSRWSEISKRSGLLYVHCVPPAKTLPSASPYVLKVQTFLRFAGIPHELDHTDPMGGNGKTPWISLNGENMADSEFILEFLRKTYGDSLNSRYSPEEVAVAKSVRVMLEEHAVWGMFLERFVYGSRDKREQVFSMNILKGWLVKKVMRGRGESQGLGLHKEEDMVKLISADFKVVSQILGGKKFILGDQPCAEDAGIFGQLCQFYWGLPNSPYEALLNGECRNLRDYCYRIRETFWPEWKLLVKISEVNKCRKELVKAKGVDYLAKYTFVRIVRAGSQVTDPNLRQGSLVIISKNSGRVLENLSKLQGQEHRLIKESHVVAYADF